MLHSLSISDRDRLESNDRQHRELLGELCGNLASEGYTVSYSYDEPIAATHIDVRTPAGRLCLIHQVTQVSVEEVVESDPEKPRCVHCRLLLWMGCKEPRIEGWFRILPQDPPLYAQNTPT